jgi:hypothetical protein
VSDRHLLHGLSDSARPVLFLDVDGVLNCLNATVPVEHIHPGTGFQVVVPDPRVGLTDEHVRELLIYANADPGVIA